VRHVLVSSSRGELLAEGLRAHLPPSAVVLSARGIDATLETLGRSARVDAVVTDDPEVEAAIREEVPGSLPVLLVSPGARPAETIRLLAEALGEPWAGVRGQA